MREKQETYSLQNFLGKTPIYDDDGFDTGDYILSYTELKTARMTMTPNKGNASVEVFGSDLNYSRTLRTDDMSCDLAENSLVWINNALSEPHDYIVIAKAEGLTNIAYAIRKVDVSEV